MTKIDNLRQSAGSASMGPDSEWKLFSKYQTEWETNARFDAKWAVLSLVDRLGCWDEQTFFRIGVGEVDEVFAFLKRNRIELPVLKTCLDFGCGVGRITQALASRFEKVVGIDISPSMLEHANSYRLKMANTTYVLSKTPELERTLGRNRFDLIYSNITLQHLDCTLQKQYIRQFARILKSNGLAIFQIPSQGPRGASASVFASKILLGLRSVRPRSFFSLISNSFRSRVPPWRVRMELNVLPEAEVESVAAKEGLELLTKAYVVWDRFYLNHEFVLAEKPDRLSGHFPRSTVYFFRGS
jgi:SAM-dependent methyltransferase